MAHSNPQSSERPTRPVNIFKTLKLETIKPIQKAEIPVRRGRGRGTLHDLKVVKEFEVLLDYIKERGISPTEVYAEIDTKSPDLQAERRGRKSFAQSFRKLLRQKVKDRSLSGQIDVVEFDRGDRIFIVGRSDRAA